MDGKIGLVLSGGGAKGAFTAGAIEVLHENGISFDVVSGTSVGALCAAMTAQGKIARMVELFSSIEEDDILKKRYWFIPRWWKSSFYDNGPLQDLLEEELKDDPYKIDLVVTTVGLKSGDLFVHNLSGTPPENHRDLILASTAIPVMFPPSVIDGRQHVDGGVRTIAPLKPLIVDKGCTDIWAIVLQPEQIPAPDEEYDSMKEILERTIDIMTDEILIDDLKKCESRNRHEDYKTIELHIIRPKEDLGGSLDFDRDLLDKRLNLGRAAAREALG